MRALILYLYKGNVEIKANFETFYLSLILSMVIYQLTNIDDKFIMIKSFSLVFDSILYRHIV
jgi:hypothetical protein